MIAWTGLKCRDLGAEDDKRLTQRHRVDGRLRHEVGGVEAAVEAVDDPIRAGDQDSLIQTSRRLPVGQRCGHTLGSATVQPRRGDNLDLRTVAEPGIRSPQRVMEGLVLAGRQGWQSAGTLVGPRRDGETGAAMVAVTRPGIDRVRPGQAGQTVDQSLIVAVETGHPAQPRIKVEHGLPGQHESAAHGVGAGGDLGQRLRNPVGCDDAVGVSGCDDAAGKAEPVKPVQRLVHGEPASPADVGMAPVERDLYDVQGKAGVPGAEPVGNLRRPVRAVVEQQDDLEDRRIEPASLPVSLVRKGAQACFEMLFLVVGRNCCAQAEPGRRHSGQGSIAAAGQDQRGVAGRRGP